MADIEASVLGGGCPWRVGDRVTVQLDGVKHQRTVKKITETGAWPAKRIDIDFDEPIPGYPGAPIDNASPSPAAEDILVDYLNAAKLPAATGFSPGFTLGRRYGSEDMYRDMGIDRDDTDGITYTDAVQAINAIVERHAGAEAEAREAAARASVAAKVREAMETADDEDSLIGWDCMADETIVDWDALAEAAVGVFVELLRNPPAFMRDMATGKEWIEWPK